MTILAQDIVHRVVDTLQDTTSVRWPVPELVRYLNDGQREVVLYRPDATIKSATVTCVAGPKQSLPSDAAKLIDVIRNSATGTSRAVRMVAREVLDAQIPDWYGLSGQLEIVHFTYDPRDPQTFFVYPPATNTSQVDITYSAFPTEVDEPTSGSAEYSDVEGNIDIPDIYGNVLIDYILYRAYSKDSEYAGNAQRAQAHYGAFANALNIEIQGTTGVSPKV